MNEDMATHLHGVLNIHKPASWTSHDVVLFLRRRLGIQKIGHAGTLDPSATGVLPMLLGKGTKIADRLLEWEKEYSATLRLGQSTDTQDATGTVIYEASADLLSEKQIRTAFGEFSGKIQQVPPMYSAVKVHGQPLYKAARRGETVTRSARFVTIYSMDIQAIRGNDVDFRVVCSKGTYIRTLCEDIGKSLQVGGHLLRLERSRVGPLHVQDAVNVEACGEGALSPAFHRAFLTIDQALDRLPFVTVKSEYVKKVLNGAPIHWSALEIAVSNEWESITEGQSLRIRDPQGHLLALGTVTKAQPSITEGNSGISIENVLVEQYR